MKTTAQTALIVYSGCATAALVWFLVSTAGRDPHVARYDRIEVGRIDLREPDGTLRMTISNAAQSPGIVVRGREYPHPDRRTAGVLFFNDEGTENGGLIFGGHDERGKPFSSGSLTFDRYEQDQVVQVTGSEEGDARMAGVVVNDHPEARMDFDAIARLAGMPAARRTPEAYAAAHAQATRRAFFGRDLDGASKLVLRDGTGRERMVMRVAQDGESRLDFLDERGTVVRTVSP